MYLDLKLNLATFQYIDGIGCYHFCLNRFGLKSMNLFERLRNFRFSFGTAGYLGLEVNTGFQPPTRWELFVADTLLRLPDSEKRKC